LGNPDRPFFLILLILLPIIIVQLFIYYSRLKVFLSREFESNLEIARAVCSSFDRIIQEEWKHARVIGQILFLSDPLNFDSRDLKTYLAEFAAYGSKQISILSPEGRVLASSKDVPDGLEVLVLAPIREIINGRDKVIANIFQGRLKGKPLFIAAYGIRDKGGALRGIIVLSLNLDQYKSFLGLNRFRGGDITIINKNKRIVFRSPEIPRLTWEQRDVCKKLIGIDRALAGKKLKSITSATFDGSRRLCAMVPVKSAGWVVQCQPERRRCNRFVSQIHLL
jgi:hypothetical protein